MQSIVKNSSRRKRFIFPSNIHLLPPHQLICLFIGSFMRTGDLADNRDWQALAEARVLEVLFLERINQQWGALESRCQKSETRGSIFVVVQSSWAFTSLSSSSIDPPGQWRYQFESSSAATGINPVILNPRNDHCGWNNKLCMKIVFRKGLFLHYFKPK